MMLARVIKDKYIKDILIIIVLILESIFIVEMNFNHYIVLDRDLNFPLNLEGSLRWIYNNLDGYTFDFRNINRVFIGLIFYILYSIYNSPVIFKYFVMSIIFLSLLLTYYSIKELYRIKFNQEQNIVSFIISQLIVFNNFTLQSRFTSLSLLIFLYIYEPATLYLILKYIRFNKRKYILYLFIINLVIPITQPIYFVIWYIFLALYILPLVKRPLRYFINLLLGFTPLFAVSAIQALAIQAITEPYLSSAYVALQQNSPTLLQFLVGINYPIAFDKYCVTESQCYRYNEFASYYLDNFVPKIIYLSKIIIFVIPLLIRKFIRKKGNLYYLYYLSLYLFMIFIITSPWLFTYSETIALAMRFPYHRLAFPLLFTEMILLMYITTFNKFAKITIVLFLLSLYIIYYLPLYSGMLFINTPLENYKLPIDVLNPLLNDIKFIRNLNNTILYIPYSATSYFVCFSINNSSIIYYFINPFYLFSDCNVIYNSKYLFEKHNNNLTRFIIDNYNNIVIVIEKYSCLYNSTIAKFDNRMHLEPNMLFELLKKLNINYTVYELSNYYVILPLFS